MKKLVASSHGISTPDKLLLSAYLELVALTDGHVFALGEEPNAPIRFLDANHPAGASVLANQVPGVAYVCVGHATLPRTEGVWNLPLPIRFAPLREILVAVVAQRFDWKSKEAARIAEPNAVPTPDERSGHRKLEQWLKVLDRVAHVQSPHEMCGVDTVEFIAYPHSKHITIGYLNGRNDWLTAIAQSPSEPFIRPRQSLQHAKSKKLISYERFCWELARKLSNNALLPGIAHLTQFSLIRWPDFGALGVTNQYDLRACALLANRSATISTVIQASKVSQHEVIGLINACALNGCLRGFTPEQARELATVADSRSVASPVPRAQSKTFVTQRGFIGFIDRIRSALSLSKAKPTESPASRRD